MKKEVSRWSDSSTVRVIHTPTEEEKREGIKMMVDNAVSNLNSETNEDTERKDKE